MPSLTTYKLLKQEHDARRGEFKTVHGTVQTPAFQNVATAGAIKGGLSAQDLKDIGAQVMLCNTYHLHLRPGDKLVADMGGLHKFTRWNGPILTDSGGFQVFSLAKLQLQKSAILGGTDVLALNQLQVVSDTGQQEDKISKILKLIFLLFSMGIRSVA